MNSPKPLDPTARLAQALAKMAKERKLQLYFVGANADQFNAAIKENEN
jgi:UDP-N-acetyl-D-mannosaminuronic acid transferase (WecB/TagA/CpsF family)